MKWYLDSSVLVKLYVTEEFSMAARKLAQAVPQLPVTWLHTLEVGNAFRVLVGRGLLSREESRLLQEQWEEDRQKRRLVECALDWPKVFHAAVGLSQVYSTKLLTRSLDILYVAVEFGCVRFASANERQLKLAKVAGRRAMDIREA